MLRNRVNRVLLTIWVGAAVCAFPVALAAARAPGGPRVPTVAAVAQPYDTGTDTSADAGADGRTARLDPDAGAAPDILFPIPTQGPPRQFPLPGPSTKPAPPPATTPPARPAPARPKPVPRPTPRPVVAKPVPPKPKPTPKPPPKPAPKPAPQPQLPPQQYHAVPQRHLTTVLIVFLVAIVPVSLARVRR